MAYGSDEILAFLQANPTYTDAQIAQAMDTFKVTPEQMAAATGLNLSDVQSRYDTALGGMGAYTSSTPSVGAGAGANTSFTFPVQTALDFVSNASNTNDMGANTSFTFPVQTALDFASNASNTGGISTLTNQAGSNFASNADSTIDSIYQVASPQDAFFKAGVNNILANTGISEAAQAAAINKLIGNTYGGDTSKAYTAFLGSTPDAATKAAYDAFLSKGTLNTVVGGTKNDTITGGTRNDTITGGTRNDTITGGTGTTTIQGQNQGNQIYGYLLNIFNAPKPANVSQQDWDKTIAKQLNNFGSTLGLDKAALASLITQQWNSDPNNKNNQKTIAQIQGFLDLGPANITTNFSDLKALLNPEGYQGDLKGGAGVDFKGSSGLREFYGPYVTDYLSRISALLAGRDAENYKPRKFGTKAKGTEQGFDPYGTDTADLLEDLAKERQTRRTTPYKGRKFTFAKNQEDTKSAATGGVMSLVDHYDGGGFVESTFDTPSGTYQQSTYDPTKASGYVAPGTYQPGTIGNTFDATKVGTYTAPTGKDTITNTFTTPTGLYTPGTIGNTFDATKVGTYTAPTGKDTITNTFTTPENLYKAGNIGSTYDPNTGLYTGPGKGITTETFDATALQRLMSPYMSGVVDPQVREARRQAEITRMQNAARMAKAGSFGGSRQAIQESELNRNLATQLEDIYGKGQQGAFDAALRAFEAEQGRKLQAATATETARQEAGRQALTGEEAKTRFGLQAATAQEAARQTAGQQALSAAQTAGQLGLQAATAQEAARQAAGQQALSAAQTAGQLGLQGQIAQEAAKQAAGQQAINAAEIAGRLGLQGSELSERSRQFAAQYGLDVAKTSAQYEQQARELQQRAEEAAARGDQFSADLALRELQEAQRAAESARAFEYQQERDLYLDPYREALYASQALSGLPIKAGDTGVSAATEAIIAALGLNKVIGG